MSEKAQDILRFDLENKKETIRNYRQRIKQADALGIDALMIEDRLRSDFACCGMHKMR